MGLLTPLDAVKPARQEDLNGYLFATFLGEQVDGGEQVYFGLSRDGLEWKGLNNNQPVLMSSLGRGGVRDPFLYRAGDRFYLLATDLCIYQTQVWKEAMQAGSKDFVLWESENLLDWSEPRLLRLAHADAGCAWAPEVIFDHGKNQHLVYWSSTSAADSYAKQRIWACWTRDFISFSEPFIYIDNPVSTIDTDIVHAGDGRYYRFSKEEVCYSITMESSDSLTGDWRPVESFTLLGMEGVEGPLCFKRNSPEGHGPECWYLMLDHYAEKAGYRVYESTDLATGRFSEVGACSFPYPFRHGSILPLSVQEFQAIRDAGLDWKKKTIGGRQSKVEL